MKESQKTFFLESGNVNFQYWKDLWFYRELFYVLAIRDISVRYKQTIIGLLWAIIRPFLTMIVFTVVFGKIANLPTHEGVPYALMVFSALLPWQLFSNSLSECSNSLIANSNLISKIYFPRLLIPASAMAVIFIDFLVCFVILFFLMCWYSFYPNWQILFLPFFILMAIFASFGISLFFASLNVNYRDFRYIIPFVVQLGLYVSPVGYSSTVIPEKWIFLYSLNPMVSVIEGFRWAITGHGYINLISIVMSWIFIIFFLWLGIKTFRKMERKFTDII